MPSIFSRKSRSQAHDGHGQSAEPGNSPLQQHHHQQHQQHQQQQFLHQQQQQQQLQTPHEYRTARRPSLPIHTHLQTAHPGLSTDNLNSPAVDLPYDDIPPDLLQRHPAHRAPSTQPGAATAGAAAAGDRPTISLVGPARRDQQHEAALYSHDNSTSDHLDKSSVEQPWPSPSHDLPAKSSAKLQKRKGFFSRHQSSASTSQGNPPKQESSLGRSVSFKNKFANSSSNNSIQQTVLEQQPEEHALGRLQTTPQQSTSADYAQNITSTTPTGDPPSSPTAFAPTTPQTPLDQQRLNDHSYHSLQHQHHHRSGSADSFPSQASSRRPSAQHTLVSDMAAIDRTGGGARQPDSQSQLPTRKDSLAAQGGQSPYPPVTQGSSFKGNISQQNLADVTGRDTPPAVPSSKLQDDLDGQDIAVLIQKHEELQAKYVKVKRYYFEKEAQVTQLQNTVAHQRMAVSRTVLDDNEYSARFSRLDGAIKELSFSIRKDWKTVPDWLHPSVNEDAVTVGTKEMTGVGRAVISRWIAEEIFERHFHPGLERTLSERLKTIEWNLRRQQPQAFSEEDKENQLARISNWRRTTLDGLSDIIQSKSALENQGHLADYLVERLLATLQCDLKDPPPPELPHGVRTIVENAINIIEKIPQEARDIVVDYIVPGTPLSDVNMKVETGLPPLTRPLGKEHSPSTERGHDSTDDMDLDKESSNSPQGGDHKTSPPHFPQNREQRKKYPFGSLMSKKSATPTPPSSSDTRPVSNTDATKDRDEQSPSEKRSRVRFATFVAVEVRGRGPNNVLMPAPVFTLES